MKWKNGVSEVGMNPGFMACLRHAEKISGIEWTITGAKEDHGNGLAVDIRCSRSPERFRILGALFAVGFSRIGVYDRHIHADRDFGIVPDSVVWLGDSQ